MWWYIYKVFYISNINIDSIACHSHSRFIYSNNILFISTYIKYVWNILTFKINLNLNLIKKKILKSTKKSIDPNFFDQRLYYVFSILLFQKIHEKLLLSSHIHPRPRTHWKRSSRHFKSWPISRYNSVALQLFPFSLSLGFKNHSSKFRENLYSSVSHIHHLLFRHEHHSDAITKEIRVHPAFSSLILSRQGRILTYINPHWSVITRSRREGKCGVFAYGSRGQICGALCQFG